MLATALLAGCGNGLKTTDAGSRAPITASSSAASSTDAAATTTTTPPAPANSPSPSDDATTPADTTPPAETTPPTPKKPTASPTSDASAPASSSGGASTVGSCQTAGLDVGVHTPQGAGAAGSTYVLLTFKNTSGSTCTMNGHPGVSFVGKGDGTQVGTSADRTGSVQRVSLAPGDTTDAVLKIANAGNYSASDCAPTSADGFRVYPPDNKQSAFVHFSTQACQTELGRGNSQLQVSAVGHSS